MTVRRNQITIYLNQGGARSTDQHVVAQLCKSFGQNHYTLWLDDGIQDFIESGLKGLRSKSQPSGEKALLLTHRRICQMLRAKACGRDTGGGGGGNARETFFLVFCSYAQA